MDAHVEQRQAVERAFPGLVIFANVGDRRTDGRIASTSGGIEELREDDVAGQVGQLDGRAGRKDPSGHIRERQARVDSEVTYNLTGPIKVGLRAMDVPQKTENCQKKQWHAQTAS